MVLRIPISDLYVEGSGAALPCSKPDSRSAHARPVGQPAVDSLSVCATDYTAHKLEQSMALGSTQRGDGK